MKKLIEKHQQNKQGRGKIILPTPEEMERELKHSYTQKPVTIDKSTAQIKQNNENTRRKIATNRAIKQEEKRNPKAVGRRQVIHDRTNPDNVRVERQAPITRYSVIDEYKENPNIDAESYRKQMQEHYRTEQLKEDWSNKVAPGLMQFSNMFFPSTWVGAAFDKDKSFAESLVLGNKGLGEIDETAGEGTNLLFDIASPYAWTKGLQLGSRALNSPIGKYLTTVKLPQSYKDYLRLGPIEMRYNPGRLYAGIPIPQIRRPLPKFSSNEVNGFIEDVINNLGDSNRFGGYKPRIGMIGSKMKLPVTDSQLMLDISKNVNRFPESYLSMMEGERPSLSTFYFDGKNDARRVLQELANFYLLDKYPIKTRYKGQTPYTLEEIKSMFTNGKMNDNVALENFYPGSHGVDNWYQPSLSLDENLKRYLRARLFRPTREDMINLRLTNPDGRSGVLFDNLDSQLSQDSAVRAIGQIGKAIKRGQKVWNLYRDAGVTDPFLLTPSMNDLGQTTRYIWRGPTGDISPEILEMFKSNPDLIEGVKVGSKKGGIHDITPFSLVLDENASSKALNMNSGLNTDTRGRVILGVGQQRDINDWTKFLNDNFVAPFNSEFGKTYKFGNFTTDGREMYLPEGLNGLVVFNKGGRILNEERKDNQKSMSLRLKKK